MIFALFYLDLIGLARIIPNTKQLEKLGYNQMNLSFGFPFSSMYSGIQDYNFVCIFLFSRTPFPHEKYTD